MLRLLTLNIGSLFEADWDLRRHEVVAWIQKLDPDVVCLQEAWGSASEQNTAAWVVDELADGRHMYFGGHGFGSFVENDPSFQFGSAVVSRWPIDDTNVWRLPTVEDLHDPMPGLMPWELVHVRTAGLDVFTTHLAPAPSHGHHRRAQVLAIDEHIRSVRGDLDKIAPNRTAMPPILTGDFNAEPESDEVRFLMGLTVFDGRTTFFQDAWAVAGDDGPGRTQDWRTHPLAASLNVHRKRIDYVLVGDPFLRAGNAGRIESCQVVCHERLTGVQASDHCGVLAEVVWPARPS